MRMHLLSSASVLICLLAVTLSGDDTLRQRKVQSQHVVQVESNTVRSQNSSVAAGRRAFVDPKTGNVVSQRPGGAPAAVLPVEAPLSTSGEGLREVPGRTRGGGIKLHLQGRFSSTVTAHISPDGNLTTRCQTDTNPN